jgi:BASS family bile acid:Na+ symporter
VTEALDVASKLTVLVFVVTCMVAAGLGLTVGEVAAPLRRGRLVAASVFANFVVAPAAAFGLAYVLPIDRAHATGLLLLGGAAGAPFLPKLAELARGDVAFSVGLMLLLMVGSVVFMPVALPLLVPGLAPEPWPLLRPLLLTMLLPLAAGMVVRWRSGPWARRLRGVFGPASNVTMLLAVTLLIWLNFDAIVGTIGTGAAIVGASYVALMVVVGYGLGGPAGTTRSVLGLGTGQRNVAAALLIATQNFADSPGVVAMLLVTTLAGLVPLVAAARWSASRPAANREAPAGPAQPDFRPRVPV